MLETILGIAIPFLGTTLGAAMVFLLRKNISEGLEKILLGFAAGVMLAASIWSLIQPAIEQSSNMGRWAFLPALVGFLAGILLMLLIDTVVPHLHANSDTPEGMSSKLKKTTMMTLAVTMHNVPEGMAVGVVFAAALSGQVQISMLGALSLAIGIAVQNFPEGAIISLPLRAEGMSKGKAFLGGFLSGVVEPIAAVITLFLSQLIAPALPYLLSFAAGAMIYVCVEELIPESQHGKHSNWPTIATAVGFALMMTLDVALG